MQLSLTEVLPYLQTAVGPVILISGVGMLLLTMTNRFGRVADRSRQLAEKYHAAPSGNASLREQILIFARRARLLRWAIALAAFSALFAGILILTLFISVLAHGNQAWTVILLFAASVTSLLGSVVLFIYDIQISLKALELELRLGELELELDQKQPRQ